MRSKKAFPSVAIALAAVLLAGTVAMGAGPKGPRSKLAVTPQQQQLTTCTTASEIRVSVTSGPSFVPCEDDPSGQCTELEYQVSSFQRFPVYALEGKGVVAVYPNVGDVTEVGLPCDGVETFGVGACHQQAVRTIPDETGKFRVTLAGLRRPGPTSVGIRTQGIEFCEILGVGLENSPNPDQLTQTTETVDFKGCVVEFTRDAATGEVVRAELTEDSPERCTSPFREGRILIPQPVTALEVRLKDETSLGKGKFGDGYISTGDDSCTTRVIGGKVYTWGSPCP